MAAWGSDFTVGASVVTGIGAVEGVECMLVANDPTVKGGTSNPWTLKKILRANQIALENRLPRDLTGRIGRRRPAHAEGDLHPRRSDVPGSDPAVGRGIPTIALVFGNSTAGGAYIPGMSDHVVMIKERSKVFLAGPPLVKMATGEESDDESLGGAEMHARTSGLGGLLRRRRARRHPHRPPHRRPAELAQAGPRLPARSPNRCSTPRN